MATRPPLPERLETPRLVLRRLEREDLPFLVELHADPLVTRYLGGDGRPRSSRETEAWFERVTGWYDRDGVGPCGIARREDGELVGRGGLSLFEVERNPDAESGLRLATWGRGSAAGGAAIETIVEVGYVIHPRAWGSGFAPEAARGWLEYGFGTLGEPRLSSLIHGDNAASIRVAEKNGLRCDGKALRMEGRDYLWYARAAQSLD